MGSSSTRHLMAMMINPALINIHDTLYFVTRVSLMEIPAAKTWSNMANTKANWSSIIEVIKDTVQN
jgi:hypothetical protein